MLLIIAPVLCFCRKNSHNPNRHAITRHGLFGCTMASERSPKEELRVSIRKWERKWQEGESEDSTPAELVVMACAMSDHSLSQPAVLTWMSSHLDGFGNFNRQGFIHEPSLPFRNRPIVLHSFNLVENHIDTPIYRVIGEDGFRQRISPFDEADRFLHRRLCLPRLPTAN